MVHDITRAELLRRSPPVLGVTATRVDPRRRETSFSVAPLRYNARGVSSFVDQRGALCPVIAGVNVSGIRNASKLHPDATRRSCRGNGQSCPDCITFHRIFLTKFHFGWTELAERIPFVYKYTKLVLWCFTAALFVRAKESWSNGWYNFSVINSKVTVVSGRGNAGNVCSLLTTEVICIIVRYSGKRVKLVYRFVARV